MKKYLIYFQSILILSGFIGIYAFSNYRASHRKIFQIQVLIKEKSFQFLSAKLVKNMLKNKFHITKLALINKVNLPIMEQVILNNPFVEKAQVFLDLSGKLSVEINQRKPIVRIMDNKGFYLDEKGKKMPLSKIYAHTIILAKGIDLKKEKKILVDFLKEIRKDDFLKKMIISVEQKKGKYILKTRWYDHTIHFGNSLSKGLKGKLKKIKTFYAKITKEKNKNTYTDIDVSYKNQVVCKKKTL